MKKVVTLDITDLSFDGFGLAKDGEKLYLIENALIGETIEAKVEETKSKVNYGKTKRVLVSSPYRAVPLCPHYYECGGCNMMHMKYESTLDVKSDFIKRTMKKIGHLDIDHVSVLGMDKPFAYRNKVQLPLTCKDGQTNVGYYKRKSHDVIDVRNCLLASDSINSITDVFRREINRLHLSVYDEKKKIGVIRHIILRENEKGEVMVVIVANCSKEEACSYFNQLVNSVASKCSCIISVIISINTKKTNVILGDDSVVLYGQDKLTQTLLGLRYELSYNSFFQVNNIQAEKLYSKILEFANLSGDEVVIDAYCGVGSISLQLAKRAKHVYGIEIVKEAIENANRNKEINGISNASFILGKVEDRIDELLDDKIDLIVFDPPRKGLDKSIIEMLKEKRIQKIIYVSCNYATLARDIDLLKDCYEVVDLCAVDMFAWTSEVETVCCLIKR